jgi:hypothetical protein
MSKKVMMLLHLFPREIDDFDNLANQLKVASQYISNLKVTTNIILNLNPEIIKWDTSKLSKEFIISKFNHILTKFDWCNNLVDVNDTTQYWGYLEQRAQASTKHPGYDGYILLDPDMILDDYVFYGLESALEVIQDEEFIVSPQMYKFWDSSWNIISYNKTNLNFDVDQFDPYSIKSIEKEEIKLKPNKQIKFAGGWFNYISKTLYEKINWPDGVKGYGPEDTYTAFVATKRGATQYIMEGIVVQENRKYLNNSIYVDYIDYDLEKLKQINNHTRELFNQAFNNG